MGRLQGMVAIVTGAARGIGRGIALRFAEEGARVGVLDLLQKDCLEAVSEIQKAGGEAIGIGVDVSKEDQVSSAVDTVRKAFGPIEVLVNNAAVMPAGLLHETDPAEFNRCMAVNLGGTYLMSRAVLPDMLERKKGSIIHMSSVTGVLGLPGLPAYSITKGGLTSLARAMSTDYSRHGIRVNSVSPGTIDSPMLHNFVADQTDPEYYRKAFDEMHPIGRVGTIQEVANVFVFLASDEASFVTGANFCVDGGLSVKGEQPQDNSE